MQHPRLKCLALALAAALGTALAACGGGGDDSRAQRPDDPRCREQPEVCQ